ncbi:MAG: dihydropteroate synthase [Tildeniella nuda ZEHNDER 1965/U140]|jgi:dihydropteroate synthase|nr:dihydropteroate synthase [Tildeniella nuda ZEHNDER 1965/U140]
MSTIAPLPAWTIRNHHFNWGERTYLMGVLNVTPDSFSDGGLFSNVKAAIAHARSLIAAGADILDIGGQSTRPHAVEVSLEEELNRVLPIIQAVRQETDTPISIDTTRAAVAHAAIAAGADIVNDISSATYDPEMLPTIAALRVPLVLMHIRGTPQTMQQLTDYDDLIGDIYTFLQARLDAAIASGVERDRLVIDPGIGFAKTYAQNVEILRRLPELRAIGCPLLVGASRKSFIGHLLNQPDPKKRVWGTAGACCAAIVGGADLLRIHDVRELKDVCRVADAVFRL